MSLHYFYVEDSQGDLIDVVPFCSDSCHQQWCADQGAHYQGWNGCQGPADYAEYCASWNPAEDPFLLVVHQDRWHEGRDTVRPVMAAVITEIPTPEVLVERAAALGRENGTTMCSPCSCCGIDPPMTGSRLCEPCHSCPAWNHCERVES